MLDLVSETAPQVERLGVEDLPPSTAKKPRRPSASPTPLPSEDSDEAVRRVAEQQGVWPGMLERELQKDRDAMEAGARAFVLERSSQSGVAPTQSLATGEILRVAAMVLSARALVLTFGLCAFVIALVAVVHESRAALYVLVAWSLLTVIPAITLEILTVLRRPED
jgi:hypothetical protein